MNPSKRILLIGNDSDHLNAIVYFLEGAGGYEVIKANPTEDDLGLIDSEIYHLAIVDLHLLNDEGKDFDGLEITQKIPQHIPKLIWTAYDSKGEIGVNVESVYGVVNKKRQTKVESPPDNLLQIINEIFETKVQMNFQLAIEANPPIKQVIPKLELSEQVSNIELEKDVYQIFQSLFSDATRVVIKEFVATQSGTLWFKVRPIFDVGAGFPVLVKIGHHSNIYQDYRTYYQLRELSSESRLMLGKLARSRLLGGIVYKVLGQSYEWETLPDFLSRLITQEEASTREGKQREELETRAEYVELSPLHDIKFDSITQNQKKEDTEETRKIEELKKKKKNKKQPPKKPNR